MTLLPHLGEAPHTLYAAAVRGRKGTYLEVFQAAKSKQGFPNGAGRRQAGGNRSTAAAAQNRRTPHRSIVAQGRPSLFTRAEIDLAIQLGDGNITLAQGITGSSKSSKTASDERSFSVRRACAKCGLGIPELNPRWFRLNQARSVQKPAKVVAMSPMTKASAAEAVRERALRHCRRKVRLQGHLRGTDGAFGAASAVSIVETWRFRRRRKN